MLFVGSAEDDAISQVHQHLKQVHGSHHPLHQSLEGHWNSQQTVGHPIGEGASASFSLLSMYHPVQN